MKLAFANAILIERLDMSAIYKGCDQNPYFHFTIKVTKIPTNGHL